LFILITDELALEVGMLDDMPSDVEEFDPLLFWGGIPTGEKAIVEGSNDFIKGVLLGLIASIASGVGILGIYFGCGII
jgi:hypothetical protein